MQGEEFCNINSQKNIKNLDEINIFACQSPSVLNPPKNRRKRSISRERRRSRSNSLERIQDKELDCVYSDDEEIEQEVENVYLKEQMFHEEKCENLNMNINQVKGSDSKNKKGFFSKLGDKFTNLFSSSKNDNQNDNQSLKNNFSLPQREKKVLFKVSELSQKDKDEQIYEHEVDTNVFSINFEFLKDKVAYATGDPISCTCEAVLNIHSKITPIQDSDKHLWICEFCGNSNEIFIEKEEVPSANCIDYLVQSISQLKHGYNYNDEASLIFCFAIVYILI